MQKQQKEQSLKDLQNPKKTQNSKENQKAQVLIKSQDSKNAQASQNAQNAQNSNKKIEQMQALASEINLHNKNYYELDNPTISDKEYDALYDRLVDLERETGVILPNSPTQRVGGQPLSNFTKKRHQVRLYSMGKVRTDEDLEDFFEDMKKYVQKPTFAVEYKFDGLTIVAEYNGGKFVSATTRGNGEIGEDVTAQVKTIRSLPLEIPFLGHVLFQGEGMMTNSAFLRYNRTAAEPLKNPRNGVAGAIRNLDPKETSKRQLDYFCYAVLLCEGKTFSTQQQMHDFIAQNGFKTGDFFEVVEDFASAKALIEQVDKQKNNLDVMIDGMVIKLNQIAPREEIGYTNKFPKWARAFKFEAQETSTLLRDVVWQVGRSGKVTPTAILEPVQLAGATISRATLNNIDDIRRKKVKIGSRVFIRRSNEVIPEVLGLAQDCEGSKQIAEPQFCPCCGTELVKKNMLIFCPNHDGCKEQIVARLTHFVSREAFNIEGLSQKSIEKFYDELSLRHFSDLYRITKQQLVSLEKFKDKKAENLLRSLEKSKNIEFFRFLYGIGIGEVGIKTAKDLQKHFKTLENLMHARQDELLQIEDVGEVIAQNVVDYFSDKNNLNEIQLLFEAGVQILPPEEMKSNALEGMVFVLTGTLENFSRSQMTQIIEQHGGKTSSSVSKNTTYVLAGADAGSKLEKARALGVSVISESQILKMIENTDENT